MAADLLIQKTAILSECGRYRYQLTRQWDSGDLMTFVMLNPSVADADIDDPTIRRCMSFARREKAPGIRVVNLFAFRATDPRKLKAADNPYGSGNFNALGQAISYSSVVVCAWGAHQIAVNSGLTFRGRADASKVELKCLGRTREGHPRHPLYVRADQPLEPFPERL